MKLVLAIFMLSFFLNSSWSNENTEKGPFVTNGAQVLVLQSSSYLAINYKNKDHWHTYWKNPGDAGLPLKNTFFLDGKEIKLEEQEWPVPKRYVTEGDLWAFGYGGEYSLFFNLPKNFRTDWAGKNLEIKSHWLVCKHICIPEKNDLILRFDSKGKIKKPVGLTTKLTTLESRHNELPKVQPIPKTFSLSLVRGKQDNELTLYYNLKNAKNSHALKDMSLLTPFPMSPFDFGKEELKFGDEGILGKLPISWDGAYMEPELPLPKNGQFKKPYILKFIFTNPKTNEHFIIEEEFTSFENSGKNASVFFDNSSSTPMKEMNSQDTPTNSDSGPRSLFTYLLMALLGGLILNFMPCVLPVISIKLFGLIQHSREKKSRILKHNLAYTFGVLTTFLILGGVVLLLKSLGDNVGWGFQLQSPVFVSIMGIVVFVMSLNLFGLFEFRTPGGSSLGNVELKDSFFGDFFSGVLATILSTPCSAPFLGTALTFAFSMGSATILLIFFFIGLGLSLPFLLTGIFPSTIAILPKPGMWMEHLKKFLGLTLILTTIWLIDVYGALIDHSTDLIKYNTILALIFFTFYLIKNITKKWYWQALVALLPIILFFQLTISNINASNSPTGSTGILKDKQKAGLDWQEWNEEKQNQMQKKKELVFVDFTAKWCFTCKVNEKVVLDTSAFEELVKEHNIKLLLADWTKRDRKITSYLQKNGLVGVPAYFVINKNGELINLGETITINKIKTNLGI